MRLLASFVLLVLIHWSGTSFAATKTYSSSIDNGAPGDSILATTTLCPPVQTTLGTIEGFSIIEDDGAGSVSLHFQSQRSNQVNFGPEQFEPLFGPGSFIFVDRRESRTNVPPGGMVHVGLSGSGTDPGELAVWGIISGWSMSGNQFCASSPVSICNNAGFTHGITVGSVLESGTYNLGTWAFDAVGDYEATEVYIYRTSSGGTSNNQRLLRGAFNGSSLPALPLVGFGALALSLAVIGGRSLLGKK